ATSWRRTSATCAARWMWTSRASSTPCAAWATRCARRGPRDAGPVAGIHSPAARARALAAHPPRAAVGRAHGGGRGGRGRGVVPPARQLAHVAPGPPAAREPAHAARQAPPAPAATGSAGHERPAADAAATTAARIVGGDRRLQRHGAGRGG